MVCIVGVEGDFELVKCLIVLVVIDVLVFFLGRD